MSNLTYAKFVSAAFKHPIFAIIHAENPSHYKVQYLFSPEVDVITLENGSRRIRPVVGQQGNLDAKILYKTSVHTVENICYEYEIAYLTALTYIWHNDTDGYDMSEEMFTDVQNRLSELLAKQSYTNPSSEWKMLRDKVCKELNFDEISEEAVSDIIEPFDPFVFLEDQGFDLTSIDLAGKVIVHNQMDVLH